MPALEVGSLPTFGVQVPGEGCFVVVDTKALVTHESFAEIFPLHRRTFVFIEKMVVKVNFGFRMVVTQITFQ